MVPAGPAGLSWNRGAAAPRFPAAFAYAGGRVSVSPHVHGGPVAVTCNVHLSTCTQSASTGWLGGRQWAWRPSGHFGADCEVKAVQGSCRGRDGRKEAPGGGRAFGALGESLGTQSASASLRHLPSVAFAQRQSSVLPQPSQQGHDEEIRP